MCIQAAEGIEPPLILQKQNGPAMDVFVKKEKGKKGNPAPERAGDRTIGITSVSPVGLDARQKGTRPRV